MNFRPGEKQKLQIATCISKGLDFLYKQQLKHGEFRTYLSLDKNMQEKCTYVSTTYITAFVIYSLSFINSPQITEMTRKALNFFLEEMEHPGIWRFFGVNRNIRLSGGRILEYTPIGIIPDLDDTACIAYSLKMNKVPFDDNLEFFLKNRNEYGVYYTWLMDYPKRKEFEKEMVYLLPKNNDICCCVNSNILLYLGQNDHTEAICEFLNNTILEGKEESNLPYFPGKLVLYYMLSRAYFNGAISLQKSRDLILKNIIVLQLNDGSYESVLSAAFAVCTFINFNCYDDSLGKTIQFIISQQKENGSWPKERFCEDGTYYYGSEEFTSGICLESLSRYLGRNGK